ncbi:DJ-1/PfpI family protein [Egicoccus sp. AB-alg2]|uniref:DJ-1/PfpI family protein n=1 Tax=Egicoccus sp. AB-alg2 TaxID=3242693 RepID=UPI00359EEEF3
MPASVISTLIVAAVAAIGATGAVRAKRAARTLYPAPPPVVDDNTVDLDRHDPDRPTALVLLDHAGTEVSDFLLPYELLAASRAFNVYAVAPERRPATLTGGLDVVPHLGFADVATLPSSRVEVVVVPHLPTPDDRVLGWLRARSEAGALVLTICTGAGVAAAAGLLDGRTSTAHWGDIGRFERRYPQVRWRRDVRYVDDGDFIASAGITSGIDATLHVIRRLAGDEGMHRAAETVGYTDLGYLDDPAVEPFRVSMADLIVVLRAAFARRPRIDVFLDDDVDEFALAAVMDTLAASFTARLTTVTPDGTAVRTRHGLTVIPRASAATAPASQRRYPARTSGTPYRAFDEALTDLADLGGRAIARFAAKRLELRNTPIDPTTTQNDHARSIR